MLSSSYSSRHKYNPSEGKASFCLIQAVAYRLSGAVDRTPPRRGIPLAGATFQTGPASLKLAGAAEDAAEGIVHAAGRQASVFPACTAVIRPLHRTALFQHYRLPSCRELGWPSALFPNPSPGSYKSAEPILRLPK